AGQRGVVGGDDRVRAQVKGRGGRAGHIMAENKAGQGRAQAVCDAARRAQGLAADGADRAVAIFNEYPHSPAHMTFSSKSLLTRMRACSSTESALIISTSPSRGGTGYTFVQSVLAAAGPASLTPTSPADQVGMTALLALRMPMNDG